MEFDSDPSTSDASDSEQDTRFELPATASQVAAAALALDAEVRGTLP